MRQERTQILGMVAAGRITALEGERLLLAWSEERESRWVFGACAAPAVVNFLHAVWLQVQVTGLHHVAELVSRILGGAA